MPKAASDQPIPPWLRRGWHWIALAGCAVFVHLGQLRGRVPYWRDMHLANVPGRDYLHEVLRNGELPQWWPFEGGGTPLLAMPTAEIFHPSVLLTFAMPPLSGLAVHGLLATLAAAWGACLLARLLGQQRVSAFVAGLAYAANGYVLGLVEQTFMLTAAATVPWYAASLLVARRRGGAWHAAPALVFALQILAGDPQAAILAAAAGLVIALAADPAPATAALALLAPVGGALLSAVQILPALRLIPSTSRAAAPTNADSWALEGRHLAGLLLPALTEPTEYVFSTCLGVGVVALAAASLPRARRRPVVAALLGLTLVSIWLALGDGWGLNALARAVVPIWDRLRFPVKSILPAMLALSLLAGEGLRELSGRRRRTALLFAAGAAALAVPAGLLYVERMPIPVAATLAAVAAAVLFVHPRGPARSAIPLALSAQVLSLSGSILPTADPSFYSEPPLATRLALLGVGLEGPAFERIDPRPHAVSLFHEFEMAGVGGQRTATGALWRLPCITAYSPAASNRLLRLFDLLPRMSQERAEAIYGTLGAGFLVITREAVRRAHEVLDALPRLGYVLVRNPVSLPRAYGIACARAAPFADIARLLHDPSFDPRHELLVEGTGGAACPPDAPAFVEARIAARTNASVEVDAQMPWDGWLVLNEARFDGWTADVDGADAPILPAYGVMRAVRVPAGGHVVHFRYETPGLATGATISGASLLALAFAASVLRRRGARK